MTNLATLKKIRVGDDFTRVQRISKLSSSSPAICQSVGLIHALLHEGRETNTLFALHLALRKASVDGFVEVGVVRE